MSKKKKYLKDKKDMKIMNRCFKKVYKSNKEFRENLDIMSEDFRGAK